MPVGSVSRTVGRRGGESVPNVPKEMEKSPSTAVLTRIPHKDFSLRGVTLLLLIVGGKEAFLFTALVHNGVFLPGWI